MPLSFTRALEVAPGDPITSTQHNALARAFNDRLRAFQMCAWRIVMWWFNAFRQVRNPAEGGFVFPPQAEYWDIYQHLDPENGQPTWPVADPGESEGANLANPAMAFVFGNPGLDQEDIRLSNRINTLPPAGLPPLEGYWEAGKAQRGAFDPDTGGQFVPAFDAAQDFFRIVQPFFSPHGKSYGGYFPTPVELLANCGLAEDTGLYIPSYEFKFTGLRSDVVVPPHHGTQSTVDGKPVITYAGSCPCGTEEHAAGHVIWISDAPFGYYVFVGTGDGQCGYNLDRFPKTDWLQGPYEGEGRLARDDGKHLDRALWAFAVDFRGAPHQRTPDDYDIEQIAFDNEAFYNSQYYLAPNIGVVQGDTIFERYPRAEFAGSYVSDGTLGRFEGGDTQHLYRSGFVLAGIFAKAKNLSAPARVEILDGSNGGASVLASLTLTPATDGAAEATTWLQATPSPKPLKVRLATPARFIGVGSISVEVTEQYEYKPQPWDAYLVARLAATAGGTALLGTGVDGRGRDYSLSKEITEDYFGHGCIVNRFGVAGVRDIAAWVNDNPVYDAARRLSRDHARIVRRQNLVSYEVTGGKSVLRFRRFAYGLVNTRADMFQAIAPPLDPVPSGALIEGETYIVRATGNGKVAYQGGLYANDQTFTALGSAPASGATIGAPPTEYQATGDAQVFVHDGIKHAALKKGFTNQWVLFTEAKRYHPSASSVWKPDAYSDYFAWCQRCHFYSGTAPSALRRHIAYNHTVGIDPDTFQPVRNPMSVQAQFLSPEAPDQYNYTANANRLFGGPEFYSSCRVYEAPYEIESCVVDDWSPDQVIKLTLKTRLRSHPDAPAAVNKDPSTWSASEVQILRNEYAPDPAINEDYRTDDNAIREYVLHQGDSTKQCTVKIGDSGTGSGVDGLPDNPFGCCYPHFFFCRLLPEVYEDNNDVMEGHDTRAVMDSMLQAEVYLRAMCEGFVDGRTSQDIICRTGHGNLYDYKFENLCFDAFNGREIGCFPLDKRIDASGFGPLPNSIMYAEVFTRLVKAVNLLDKVRLDLPIRFASRAINYVGEREVNAISCSGTEGCQTDSFSYAYLDGASPPAMAYLSTGGWDFGVAIGASGGFTLDGCPHKVSGSRTDTEYRVEIDPAFANAVPAAVQDLIDLGHTGFLAQIDYAQSNTKRQITNVPGEGDGCGPGASDSWFDSDAVGDKFYWVTNLDLHWSECKLVTSGVLSPPGVPSSDVGFGSAPPHICNQGGGGSSVGMTLIAEQGAFIQVPLT